MKGILSDALNDGKRLKVLPNKLTERDPFNRDLCSEPQQKSK
jgi:hypothetical protein